MHFYYQTRVASNLHSLFYLFCVLLLLKIPDFVLEGNLEETLLQRTTTWNIVPSQSQSQSQWQWSDHSLSKCIHCPLTANLLILYHSMPFIFCSTKGNNSKQFGAVLEYIGIVVQIQKSFPDDPAIEEKHGLSKKHGGNHGVFRPVPQKSTFISMKWHIHRG